MGKKLYVGNLAYSTNDQGLSELFSQFGGVTSAKIITDRDSGRSKGFGFIEMENDGEADQAIEKLHGSSFEGRNIVVSEARPQEERPRGGGGGGRGFGGGGGRGGGDRGDRGGRGGGGGGYGGR
jgi:cold-inducible RNA-binding protein